MPIGKRVGIQVFLVRHGLRQEDLAVAVGLTRTAISNLVTGKSVRPRRDTCVRVLEFCRQLDPNITYDQLFGAESAERAEPAA